MERALADRGIGGVVTLPLVARGEVAGIVALATTDPLALGPGDMRVLSRVADGIALWARWHRRRGGDAVLEGVHEEPVPVGP